MDPYGTRTGRTMSNPEMQELRPRHRPKSSNVVATDFSRVELRMLAMTLDKPTSEIDRALKNLLSKGLIE